VAGALDEAEVAAAGAGASRGAKGGGKAAAAKAAKEAGPYKSSCLLAVLLTARSFTFAASSCLAPHIVLAFAVSSPGNVDPTLSVMANVRKETGARPWRAAAKAAAAAEEAARAGVAAQQHEIITLRAAAADHHRMATAAAAATAAAEEDAWDWRTKVEPCCKLKR